MNDTRDDLLDFLIIRLMIAIFSSKSVLPANDLALLTLGHPSGRRGNGKKPVGNISAFGSTSKLRNLSQTVYLLNTIQELAYCNRQVTQREIFYRSLSAGCLSPGFSDQIQMNRALMTLMGALGCGRHDLGVFTTARGLVCANLEDETLCLNERGDFIANLSAHPDGLSSSEILTTVHTIQTAATCILIVEKDTVFQALIRTSSFFARVPCILVTARGYPDTITIRLLQRMRQIFGLQFPFLYLGDLDPHGVSIFLTYHRSLESNLEWIGIHYDDIELEMQQLLGIKMKSSDYSLLSNLIVSPETPEYVKVQLCKIEKRGLKYEVECMHAIGQDYLATKWLPKKVQSKKASEYFAITN